MKNKPNVLVLFACSLRKDRWGGMSRVGKLIRRSGWTEFSRHYGVAHCSDPNFLSLLTGGHPDDHKVFTQMGTKYVKQFPTLQKRFSQDGYYTWSYGPIKVPAFYRIGFDEALWHKTEEVSPLMAPGPKQAIRNAGKKPWFGFMRLMDVHYPYMGKPFDPSNQEEVIQGYNNATAHIDKFISHLVRWVLKNYPNTVILLGSDHGEMLGEHGLWDHLFTLKGALVQVPAAVYIPDSGPAKVHNHLTQHTDLTRIIFGEVGWHEQPRLENPGGLWSTAWGVGHRDAWKHKALILDWDNNHTLQYTVNWHVEHGPSFELHIDGDYITNHFSNNDMCKNISEIFIEKYPTFPRPDFSLPIHELKKKTHLLQLDAVALGDAKLMGDGMVTDENVAVSLRPAFREVA